MKNRIADNVYAMKLGIILTLLTFGLGFGLGAFFGVGEDFLQDHLRASGEQVLDQVYHGDKAKLESVLDKSWTYFIRAHLHAGAMAAAALGMILLMAITDGPRMVKSLIAFLLGAGGFGYALFWLLAGLRAPALGGTGLAKESLKWLAVPSSGGFILALLCTLVVFAIYSCGCKGQDPDVGRQS